MGKSARIEPQPVSPQPRARSRWRGPLRLLITMAVLSIVVVFVFPLIFGPRVEVPTALPLASPSSVPVQISNQNLTPLMDVRYSCEVAHMTLANGSSVSGANVLIEGTIRQIDGRHAVAARCQLGALVTDPVKAAEYKLTLSYRAYPWPKQHTVTYRIVAQIDPKGQITGWKLV